MKSTPTAKEYNFEYRYRIGKRYTGTLQISQEIEMMEEFVKLHLEAQRKAIQKTLESQEWIDNFINLHDKECKKAIKNAYSLKK